MPSPWQHSKTILRSWFKFLMTSRKPRYHDQQIWTKLTFQTNQKTTNQQWPDNGKAVHSPWYACHGVNTAKDCENHTNPHENKQGKQFARTRKWKKLFLTYHYDPHKKWFPFKNSKEGVSCSSTMGLNILFSDYGISQCYMNDDLQVFCIT